MSIKTSATGFKRKTKYSMLLGEQEHFVSPLISQFIDEALDLIGAPKPLATVLDVGAGECPLKDILEDRAYTYFSLDIEQNTVGSIDYVAKIDAPLPAPLFSSSNFDLLILTEVLEHVSDWSTAFQNVTTLLKPGGFCILTTPFFYMLHEEPHDFWRSTDHSIRFFADINGLEVLSSKRSGDGWDVLGTLLCSTSVCRKRKTTLAYLAVLPVWSIHRILKYVVKSRFLQSLVQLQMGYYLTNLVILRKPSVV